MFFASSTVYLWCCSLDAHGDLPHAIWFFPLTLTKSRLIKQKLSEIDNKLLQQVIHIDRIFERTVEGAAILELLREGTRVTETDFKRINNLICDCLKSLFGWWVIHCFIIIHQLTHFHFLNIKPSDQLPQKSTCCLSGKIVSHPRSFEHGNTTGNILSLVSRCACIIEWYSFAGIMVPRTCTRNKSSCWSYPLSHGVLGKAIWRTGNQAPPDRI